MTERISKFRALSRPERKVLLTAMLLMPLFWIGLRVFGLPRFHAWLDRPSPRGASFLSAADAAAIADLVNIAGHHGPAPSSCLTRSLLLAWLLRRRGVESELRIGVRLNEDKLEAHAWVERDGRPINDAGDIAARFAAFDGPLSPKSFS